MNNPRGSIWRKWDMQVHVPGSKHADQYSTKKGEDVWDKFLGYIVDCDVDVFGVTDYFSIQGYETLKSKINGKSNLKSKRFFPCVELRLDISVNHDTEQLQCHLIFDNEYDITKIKNFLAHLPLKNKKSNGSVAYCTDADITVCGGYDRVSVSKEELEKSLRNSFGDEKPYLVAGVASGMGSNMANPNANIKRELADLFDSFCDFFFGNEGNIDYYLKDDRYDNKEVRSKAKPVVSTSDCHTFNDCDNKLGRKFVISGQDGNDVERHGFTWIKANPTFEGLKQIIYEPQLRTKIQTESPDTKKPYFVIDKTRFIDNSGDTFPAEYLPVNPDLTTIIGGKSTGKSLLLFYIAKTLDAEEVNERLGVEGMPEVPYDFDSDPYFDFEVIWRDGTKQSLKQPEGGNKQIDRKILYIPQNYLNKLSEKNLHSKLTLNEFVLNVLIQDEVARTKHSAAQKRIGLLKKNIQNELTDLFQLAEEGKELAESIKQKGDAAGIQKYIKTLQAEVKTIKEKSGLTKSEIKTYEEKVGEIEKRTETVSRLEDDKDNLLAFHEALIGQSAGLQEVLDEYEDLINTDSIRGEIKKEFSFIGNINNQADEAKQKIALRIEKAIKAEKAQIKKLETELKPLVSKVKLRSSLATKNKTLTDEQAKLSAIVLDQKKLDSKRKAYVTKQGVVFGYYSDIYNCYLDLTKDFALYDNHFDDISLNVVTEFKVEPFNRDVVNEYLNKTDVKRIDSDQAQNAEYSYIFDPTNHLSKIETIYKGLLRGDVKTVKGRSRQDAISHLLEDLFYLDFRISYKGDSLQKMSPGKKGLVLLRLLIDLSDEEWPILLDQPEDDLDNRSIYNELAIYLTKKKQSRQILIVTHNPNLVVTTDSEEVIVANQSDQEAGRDNRKYKFEYVSGALEDTFEKTDSEEPSILYRKGIREHTCEILEGGKDAFSKREEKYSLRNRN